MSLRFHNKVVFLQCSTPKNIYKTIEKWVFFISFLAAISAKIQAISFHWILTFRCQYLFFGENGDLIAFFYTLKFHSEMPKNNEIRKGKKQSIAQTTSSGTTTELSEIWKDITGYEGLYQVSSLGRVRSLTRKVSVNGRQLTNVFFK